MIELFVATAFVCGLDLSEYATNSCVADYISKPFTTRDECTQAGISFIEDIRRLNLERGMNLEIYDIDCKKYVVPDYVDDKKL